MMILMPKIHISSNMKLHFLKLMFNKYLLWLNLNYVKHMVNLILNLYKWEKILMILVLILLSKVMNGVFKCQNQLDIMNYK